MNRNLGRLLAGLLAVTAGTAAIAGAGLAAGHPAPHEMLGMSRHGGMAAMDPAAMDAHVDKMLAEMVPDATAEQKARLKTIAKAVHSDLGGVHAQFGQAHQQAHALLLQPTIDRAGLEALRVEQVRQVDVASQRVVAAIADAAEVLTPEQRVRIAAKLKARAH